MDDFSVSRDSFELCLSNLACVVQRCEETNLILNWEKYLFMVEEGIVLRHKLSASFLEVDKTKIKVIEKLLFLGHAGSYKRFIKDFIK